MHNFITELLLDNSLKYTETHICTPTHTCTHTHKYSHYAHTHAHTQTHTCRVTQGETTGIYFYFTGISCTGVACLMLISVFVLEQ